MAVVCTATRDRRVTIAPNLQEVSWALGLSAILRNRCNLRKVRPVAHRSQAEPRDSAIAARMYGFYSPLNAPNTVSFSKGS